jgi:hypothetical protein
VSRRHLNSPSFFNNKFEAISVRDFESVNICFYFMGECSFAWSRTGLRAKGFAEALDRRTVDKRQRLRAVAGKTEQAGGGKYHLTGYALKCG